MGTPVRPLKRPYGILIKSVWYRPIDHFVRWMALLMGNVYTSLNGQNDEAAARAEASKLVHGMTDP